MEGSHRVLVTGATGFIGSFLCKRLLAEQWLVRGTLLPSESASSLSVGVEPVLVEALGVDTQWEHALAGVDTVIHLAARVHIMADPAADPLDEFRKTNVAGTLRLAQEAARSGVKRFVFISSIKVNGEESSTSFTSISIPSPSDAYGISKYEAELGLRQIEKENGLEVVVVRPTLVYGPGVKANFYRMMQVVFKGVPLPFAAIRNRRSLVYVGNLVDALALCAKHPAAAGKSYLVSDGEDVSTPELITKTAAALGVKPRMFPVPTVLMGVVGTMTGKRPAANRLIGSLSVDISALRGDLQWSPPFSMDEGLRETATWFKTIPDNGKPRE